MDPPDSFAAAGEPSPTRRELQGPRPPPLRVSKDSRKIKKPPVAPPHHPPQPQPREAAQSRQTVIIYSVSPRVIHTTVSDFMDLVQRLTGPSPTAAAAAAHGGDVSPAARLASIERTSPSEREREREKNREIVNMVEDLDLDLMPGILSPAPASLAPVPAGFFSPQFDPQMISWLNDLSPSIHNTNNMFVPSPSIHNTNNMFVPSPSNLFSAPIVSPSSSYEMLSQFLGY